MEVQEVFNNIISNGFFDIKKSNMLKSILEATSAGLIKDEDAMVAKLSLESFIGSYGSLKALIEDNVLGIQDCLSFAYQLDIYENWDMRFSILNQILEN